MSPRGVNAPAGSKGTYMVREEMVALPHSHAARLDHFFDSPAQHALRLTLHLHIKCRLGQPNVHISLGVAGTAGMWGQLCGRGSTPSSLTQPPRIQNLLIFFRNQEQLLKHCMFNLCDAIYGEGLQQVESCEGSAST